MPAAKPSKPQAEPRCIRLRGVRQNNLKGFDLDLPLGELIVITGRSGSGKSSLAFETLYAEGQRRYIETFSPYARQFFDRMDKPAVDRIENIPPAIAIEQRNSVRTTRSTVGTMTEICDHMKTLWPHIARLHCRQCGQVVRKEAPQWVWESTAAAAPGADALITFELPLSERLSFADQLGLLQKQGFQRVLAGPQVLRVEEAAAAFGSAMPSSLTVVADRVKVSPPNRQRFIEACEQAYHFGRGKLSIRRAATPAEPEPLGRWSAGFHCARCDLDYREPTPALFSFNHPVGACPTCKGFGRVIAIDPDLALPDRSLTLAGGVVRPWQSGMSVECQTDLVRSARKRGIPTDVPFNRLSAEHQRWVLDGDPGHDPDVPEHAWPRSWYGVRGYFRWLESKSYKMHVRVLLSRYRSYRTCTDCQGHRLRPDALLFKLMEPALSLADFYALPVSAALSLVEGLHEHRARQAPRNDAVRLVLDEIRTRLRYLAEVGLGYLTLDRPTRTLSGGETERVTLTTCLGTRLVNTLYVLDEPSVGLHPRDTERLIGILKRLRDLGNTLVVVEHESSVMRAADRLVDLGPGHGQTGGEIVFAAPPRELARARTSLTAQYLTGDREIPVPPRRPVILDGPAAKRLPALELTGAAANNLGNLDVAVPLNRFVCVTGVSGSGKTTLVREVLLPLLQARLTRDETASAAAALEGEVDGESIDDARAALSAAGLNGATHLGAVVLVDQSSLGRTPRSNPAVYIGAFDDIRDLFAASPEARQRGLASGHFSFNSQLGQCEHCRGAGFEKIEMQFLSDIFIRCAACQARRYREHILEIKVAPEDATARSGGTQGITALSIGDLLEATVTDAMGFLERFPDSKPAARAVSKLRLLAEVGLGYLRLGQPINTLSGGESQRLKLVSHLTDTAAASVQNPKTRVPPKLAARLGAAVVEKLAPIRKPTLFVFDEPTTGLHFEDIRVLLAVFQRIVDQGHSLLVIEHNMEVIKCADWVIDLGPEAGAAGGRLVAAGTPEHVAGIAQSHTGRHLREALPARADP
jgi:excinuclease ABC subunit A